MNNDLTEKLFNSYPTLYKKAENTLMSSSFACGDGWYHLVDVLSKLLVEQSTDLMAVQVKEKFGALRFYLRATPSNEVSDFVIGLCRMAELISQTICNQCGKRGCIRGGPYVCTRCTEHRLDPDEVSDFEVEKLPFNTDGLGKMWTGMVRVFYCHIKANPQNYPDIRILSVGKKEGQFSLTILGAESNPSMDGMLAMIRAYADIIDEETGEVVVDVS